MVPHSEVNDLDPLLFLPHIRPSLTHHWVLQRLVSGSLKTQGSLGPRSSQGNKTSINAVNVSFYKLFPPQQRHCCPDFKTMADTTSYQFPVWISCCNSPSSGLSQVRKFQRQRLLVWKGDDKEETMGERMGKWLQHKETPFPVYEISNRWSQYGYYLQKQGTNLKGESSKGRWQEGGTMVCCRRTSEMMNLPQLTLPWRHLIYQPLAPGKEMGGRDFLHMFLIRPMHPVSTYSPASMHPAKSNSL